MTVLASGLTLPPPQPARGSRAPAWWGMLCLIATAATLFVLLIFSYFYLRWHPAPWPPAGIAVPRLNLIVPATVLLLGGSIPMVWAESAIRRGGQAGLRAGLALAWLMAVAFVGIELWEWTMSAMGRRRMVTHRCSLPSPASIWRTSQSRC